MDNECKNYIHKYKCDTYNENSDACNNCEMRIDSPNYLRWTDMGDKLTAINKYDLMSSLYRIGHYCFEEYLIDDDNSDGEAD